MLYVDAFPYLNIYLYFLLPAILASVYLNFLKHNKSQLCKIILGNQTKGKHRNNACISTTFQNLELPFKMENMQWGKGIIEFD